MGQNELPIGFLKIDYDIALYCEEMIKTPKDAITVVASELANLPRETGLVMTLDYANRPICVGMVCYGSETEANISAKTVAQFALLTNASSVVLFHNHPSNGKKYSDLKPSKDDEKCTKYMADALALLGVCLSDHIIVNCTWEDNKRFPAFYSMRNSMAYKSLFLNVLKRQATNPHTYPTFKGFNPLVDEN